VGEVIETGFKFLDDPIVAAGALGKENERVPAAKG
jgi:hypothetical protein